MSADENNFLLKDLIDHAPVPWVLDECNDRCVCVMDSAGHCIYFENFTNITDGDFKNKVMIRSKLLAQWMVVHSQEIANGNI